MVSSFYVIGEIFDKVWFEGGTRYNENVQTTLIPPGGAAIMNFHVEVPGSYVMIDHSIFRAFHPGPLPIVKAEGQERQETYPGKDVTAAYISSYDTTRPTPIATAPPATEPGEQTVDDQQH